MKHGHMIGGKASPTYSTWKNMVQRCHNPRAPKYRWYGKRGIRVCKRWRVFENFLDDMGERPYQKTLERCDVNGGYEPRNCVWATDEEQRANTTRTATSPEIEAWAAAF